MEYGRQYEEQALLARRRSASGSSDDGSYIAHLEMDGLDDTYPTRLSSLPSSPRWWRSRRHRPRMNSKVIKATYLELPRPCRRRSLPARLCQLLAHVPYFLIALVIFFGIFIPSYTNPPQRYTDLRRRVEQANFTGSANPSNEKIYIAASLYDKEGDLVGGEWGESVLRLIDILGHRNVFLSVYENDPDDMSKHALNHLRARVPSDSSITYEHLDTSQLTHVTLPDGSQRLKRIAFLAEVRNRALAPLTDETTKAYHTRWDKILYINDVAFDPIDAANLLFNTNVNEATNKTDYRSACAVDFINPFKFYDTFATRDLEGHSMGLPFYPWFTRAGRGESRRDVLNQTDAVRVKSCWGGMVAFEAKWFQPHQYDFNGEDLVLPGVPYESEAPERPVYAEPALSHNSDEDSWPKTDLRHALDTKRSETNLPPLRFRAETDTYWDASECCLIQADLAYRSQPHSNDTKIFLNPYVRVGYSPTVLAWIPFMQRFERLYSPAHALVNWIARLPYSSPRRLEQPGDEVVDRVWMWDDQDASNGTHLHGSFQEMRRTALPGQFCGNRKLLYIKQHREGGERPWEEVRAPDGSFE